MSSDQCIEETRIDCSLTRPPLQKPNEHNTAPEYALQIDLFPELSSSGCYETLVTDMDVCVSRCLFAYPISNQDAKTFSDVLIRIMAKHAYLTTTLISDKGSALMSDVIKGVVGVQSVTLKLATTKDAQTIGLL